MKDKLYLQIKYHVNCAISSFFISKKKNQFFGDNLVMKIKTKNLEHPDSVACHSETPSNGRDRN